MSITANVTLTVTTQAMYAANKLRAALVNLNAAGEGYAWSGDAAPYGMCEAALIRVLGQMVGGDMEADGLAEQFGRYVSGECSNNGEAPLYQITTVLGWTVLLTDEEGRVEETHPGTGSNYVTDSWGQQITALAVAAR